MRGKQPVYVCEKNYATVTLCINHFYASKGPRKHMLGGGVHWRNWRIPLNRMCAAATMLSFTCWRCHGVSPGDLVRERGVLC